MKKLVLITCILSIGIFVLLSFFLKNIVSSSAFKDQIVLGNKNSTVEVLVFSDFHCGYCREFAIDIFPVVQDKYIRKGKIKYVFVPLNFVNEKTKEANALLCVNNYVPTVTNNFLKHLYFKNVSLDSCIEMMLISKADKSKIKQCSYNNLYKKTLQNNLKVARKMMKGNFSVPAVFVNNKRIEVNEKDIIHAIAGEL